MQTTRQLAEVPRPDNDAKIIELVQNIRAHKNAIDQHQADIDALKIQLETLLIQRGQNWSDDEGYARLQSQGVRVFYSHEELDQLILTDPLRYGWLKDYRHESAVSARIQVK